MTEKQQDFVIRLLCKFDGARELSQNAEIQMHDTTFENMCVEILRDMYDEVIGD
jgi:hypothetical protein